MNDTFENRTPMIAATLLVLTIAWGAAVIVGAQTGFFSSLPLPTIAVFVAAGIVIPTLAYFASPTLRHFADRIGHRRIMLFHTWRIPAALLFFWYGFRGELPTLFWVLAGVGDFIAGSFAAYLLFKPESRKQYLSFHVFGFADFVVAVGTGLTFTLLEDPRMMLITVLPMALVPLFGVGISGASHLIAFDMLRRGTGMATQKSAARPQPA